MYSKIQIYLIFFFGVFYSCTGTKQITTPNKQIYSLQASYNISASTKLFLVEFEKELNNGNKYLQTFIPSKKLIDDYSLQQINDVYIISGFIKTRENFDKTKLINSGVTFGQKSGNIITVNIPLILIPDFINQKGIEYLEIAEKVYIK